MFRGPLLTGAGCKRTPSGSPGGRAFTSVLLSEVNQPTMALQQTRAKGGDPETRGPSMGADGLPANPSDEIFKGRALPVVPPQATTGRRPFSPDCPTRNPLRYRDGPGTDEVEGAKRMTGGDTPDSGDGTY